MATKLEDLKKCTKCKIEKKLFEYYKDKNSKDGLKYSCKQCQKNYNEENKKHFQEYRKKYFQINKNNVSEKRKEYCKNNKEKIKELRKKYDKKYLEKNKDKRNEYIKNKKETNKVYKFRIAIRTNISNSFKRSTNQFRKDAKTETILGCTIKEFITYVQSKFTNGMTLENHGEWHLDHIIPLASAITEEDIIKLCYHTNYQPLWKDENLSKGDKIIIKKN